MEGQTVCQLLQGRIAQILLEKEEEYLKSLDDNAAEAKPMLIEKVEKTLPFLVETVGLDIIRACNAGWYCHPKRREVGLAGHGAPGLIIDGRYLLFFYRFSDAEYACIAEYKGRNHASKIVGQQKVSLLMAVSDMRIENEIKLLKNLCLNHKTNSSAFEDE